MGALVVLGIFFYTLKKISLKSIFMQFPYRNDNAMPFLEKGLFMQSHAKWNDLEEENQCLL